MEARAGYDASIFQPLTERPSSVTRKIIAFVRLCKNPFVYSDYSWVSDHTSAKSVSQRLKISFLVAINTSRARW